ncbi:MAG: asparaginase [Eubacteriales bacterium]|nr:asparaginase [Eubacteriales bacterium]
MRKKVCIIHTGGALGMALAENGYEPRAGYIKTLLNEIEELRSPRMPAYDLYEYEPLLNSAEISIKEWVKLAQDIKEKYEDYDGFLIIHGADTMAYTASALSFMLSGLAKPVILTGALIPLFDIRNDARDNLVTGLLLAGNYDIPEVCIYFGEKLLRGNRAVKVDAANFVAFESPNYPELAEVGVTITLNEKHIREAGKELKLSLLEEHQIVVLKIFPGIQDRIFECMVKSEIEAVIIEAFGTGIIPENYGTIHKILEVAKEKGMIVVVCTQCLKGSVVMGEYETSRGLIKAGAVSGFDMTTEAAVTKLYYLLSRGYRTDQIEEFMVTDLRGELTRSF